MKYTYAATTSKDEVPDVTYPTVEGAMQVAAAEFEDDEEGTQYWVHRVGVMDGKPYIVESVPIHRR